MNGRICKVFNARKQKHDKDAEETEHEVQSSKEEETTGILWIKVNQSKETEETTGILWIKVSKVRKQKKPQAFSE